MKNKVGRPRKKRKHTRRSTTIEQDYTKLKKMVGQATDESKPKFDFIPDNRTNQTTARVEELYHPNPRASESSYTFVCGNRVTVRSLNDELLNQSYDETLVKAFETRRQLQILESLQFNLSMEQKFRGLK